MGPGTGTEHHAGDATALGTGRGEPLGAGGEEGTVWPRGFSWAPSSVRR